MTQLTNEGLAFVLQSYSKELESAQKKVKKLASAKKNNIKTAGGRFSINELEGVSPGGLGDLLLNPLVLGGLVAALYGAGKHGLIPGLDTLKEKFKPVTEAVTGAANNPADAATSLKNVLASALSDYGPAAGVGALASILGQILKGDGISLLSAGGTGLATGGGLALIDALANALGTKPQDKGGGQAGGTGASGNTSDEIPLD
jgi:hypothetical protein